MALAFAAAGADIVIASRNQERCQEVADIVEGMGRRALALGTHVADWDGLEELVGRAWTGLGPVDILVNNAGMSPLAPSSVETSEELWDKILGVNLKGPFRLSSLVASRLMTEGRAGAILNISSIASISPQPAYVPYAAAKAGLNAMTVGLAKEYGPLVRVNCIVCGLFHTHATVAFSRSPQVAEESQNWALRRPGDPNEVVGGALWLVSDASSYTSGTVVRIDGGAFNGIF
jgi:NAD(P)-dependent dehydrogenase (short-subunit alcohol dehydrogenase family)